MQKGLSLFCLCLFVGILLGQATAQQNSSMELTLNTPMTDSVGPPNTAYYKVTLPATIPTGSVLLVTVDSQNTMANPAIFVSDSTQFPTWDTADSACFFRSLDSCSVTDLVPNSTVYVSVYFYQPSNFTVVADLVQTQAITFGRAYEINFQDTSAGIVSFTIDKQYDEVIVVLEHLNFYLGETYEMVEACGYIPSDSKYDHSAVALGAFRKAIKLTQDEIHPGMDYYLLLAGEDQVSLKLTVQGLYSDERTIPLNNTVFDLVTNHTVYSTGLPFPKDLTNGLVIRMRQFSGYGTITVNYCFVLNFTYQDMNGDNGQLLITPAERQACLEYMENEGSLLIENIVIEADPYYGTMGVALTMYETNSTHLVVQINEIEYGMLQANTTQLYRLNVYETVPVNVSLVTYTYEGEPVFLMSKCNLWGCTPILNDDGGMQFEYDPKCKGFCHYQLSINGQVDSTYGFVFKLEGYHIKLLEGKSDMGFVEMNQYVFYNITLDNATDATSLEIHIEEITGTLSFLTSQTYDQPTFSTLFEKDSDVVYVWNGTATYYNNLTQPIYVGVLGETQGMYRLSFTVHRQQNIPSAYTLLAEDTLNEFKIGQQPLLLKYAPHSIPYSLSFFPRPGCISYGPTLPLPLTCMELPNLLNSSIFMNITGNAAGVTMRIAVDSGEFLLAGDRPLFIQCPDSCYEVIVVEVYKTERVVHSGYGKLIDNITKNEVSNGVLEISCPAGEEVCDMYLIAKLQYAGEMTLELQSSQIVEVGWWAVPLSLQSLPRKIFYRLPQNRSAVLNIDSRAAVLKVAHKIQLLNESYSNLMELQFSEDYKQVSDPFRRSYMIEVSQKHQQEMGCNQPKALCVLTVTVALDGEYEYSQDFLSNGVAYVSASSWAFYLQENINVRRIAMEEVQYFEWFSNTEKDVTVLLTPLTTCSPTMLYTSAMDEFPTMDSYQKISRRNISISNASHVVIGVVADQQMCLYDIILLTDTHGMQFMVEGVPQRVTVPSNSQSYLLYNSRSSQPFEIQSTFTKLKIFVNEVPYGGNPMNYLPGPRTFGYTAEQAPLLVVPNATSNYVIGLFNDHTLSVDSNVMVRDPQQTVTLLHNTLYRQSTATNQTDSYEYFTANSFYLFFLSSQGSFEVTVYSYTGTNATFTFNNQTKEPWVLVNATGNLSVFYIDVLSSNPGHYTVEVVEFGSEGRPTLAPGMPFFDQFSTEFSLNCYRLQGALDQKHPLQVSFVWSQQQRQKMHSMNMSLKDANPSFFYDWKPMNQDVSPTNQPKLISAVVFDQGEIYTIENKYGWYTLCFESHSTYALNEQYYVITSGELQSLVPTVPVYESHATDKFNSRYELVVLANETIITDLINCKGDSQLTASTNYEDFLSGKTTQIVDHYSDGGYYSGILNATRGYLYMGVKSLSVNNSYLLTTTSYPANSQLRLNNWKPKDLSLALHANGSDMHVTLQPLKCVSNNCNSTVSTTYHLYISNSCMTAMAYSRCGVAQSNSTPNGTNFNEKLMSYKLVYDTSKNSPNVTFKVPLKLLPDKFSVACKAETVQSNYGVNRTVPYFYGTTMSVSKSTIVSTDDAGNPFLNSGMSIGMIIFIFVAVMAVLLTGLLLVCRQRQIGLFKPPKPRVNFELQPLNSNRQDSSNPQPESERRKDTEERDAAPAYGEFVDESRL